MSPKISELYDDDDL